jgi:hypothetical protein
MDGDAITFSIAHRRRGFEHGIRTRRVKTAEVLTLPGDRSLHPFIGGQGVGA